MANEPRKKSEWLTPQNMIALLALLYGSWMSFQKDTTRDLTDLKVATAREFGDLRGDIRALNVRVEKCGGRGE